MANEYEIVWSAGAIADIEDIAQWIGRDSPHYARQVVERIYMAGSSLHFAPQRGRKVPEINDPEVRECFVYSYRMIYEVKAGMVEILAVIHGRRLLETL